MWSNTGRSLAPEIDQRAFGSPRQAKEGTSALFVARQFQRQQTMQIEQEVLTAKPGSLAKSKTQPPEPTAGDGTRRSPLAKAGRAHIARM